VKNNSREQPSEGNAISGVDWQLRPDPAAKQPGRTPGALWRACKGAGRMIVLAGIVVCGVSLSNTIRPSGIVIHHSALSSEDLAQIPGAANASDIDSLHEKRGFKTFYWGHIYHIGYHYLILSDGTVQNGRPEHCLGSHAPGHNNTLGICLVGNFSSRANPNGKMGNEEPTEAQIRSLVFLMKNLREKYGISCDQIYRHNDLNPKTLCPGDRLRWTEILLQIGCTTTK
jgi:hypothetical protein